MCSKISNPVRLSHLNDYQKKKILIFEIHKTWKKILHTLVRSAGLADARADVSVEIGTGPGRGASLGVTGIAEASKDIGIIETTDGSIPFLALFRYLSPYRSNPKAENEMCVQHISEMNI